MIHACGCVTEKYKKGIFIASCKEHKGREVWIVLKHKEKKRKDKK